MRVILKEKVFVVVAESEEERVNFENWSAAKDGSP